MCSECVLHPRYCMFHIIILQSHTIHKSLSNMQLKQAYNWKRVLFLIYSYQTIYILQFYQLNDFFNIIKYSFNGNNCRSANSYEKTILKPFFILNAFSLILKALANSQFWDSLISLIYILVGSAFIPAPELTIILILFCKQYLMIATFASMLSIQSIT